MLRYLTPLLLASFASAQEYFSAALDGPQEVPAVASPGRGWGIVRFEPTTSQVRIFLHHENLTGAPAAAHLHQAAFGVNGPIVVPLVAASPNSFTGSAVLAPAAAAALIAGDTYLNVHTAAFASGEIRGQVVPSVSTRFTGLLSGTQEVPPTPSAGQGRVVAFLHEPENRVVYDVDTTGLANVTAAHFHQAAAGVNGPIVFGLNGGSGNYCGVSDRLTFAQVAAMKANGFYVNVHTAAFASGEIRAQAIKDLGDHFVAELDGAQQVPPAPVPGIGGGSLLVTATGNLVVNGAFVGLTGPAAAAHVHLAPPGLNGPIVFPLTITGTTYSGTFTPTPADLVNLRTGNWYINVHTAAFGGGEIRGQLHPAVLPSTFGAGCLGSNGVRPQAGASSFPSLGSPMAIDLYGALPGGIELFVFGASRDSLGGVVPLPADLTSLGLAAPRCYLLVDPTTVLAVLADAFGCATQPLTVPMTPALRGQRFYSQWLSLDPPANPSGFVTSSGITLPIQ